jgi:hypothetical protein
MSSRRSVRQLLVAVLLGVLVGGGLMAVTPAGAEVSNAVATNWKKIWKKNLKPLADKRYYKKSQSDAKYATKSEMVAGDAASNATTDSKLSGYYKKAEIDAKLAPFVNAASASAVGAAHEVLTAADEVVVSVSIMPPADGKVIVSSSAYAWAIAAGDTVVRCSITQGNTVDATFMQYANMPGAELAESDSMAGTRGFNVTKGNLLTVNLACDAFSGSVSLSSSSLTAIFAPS